MNFLGSIVVLILPVMMTFMPVVVVTVLPDIVALTDRRNLTRSLWLVRPAAYRRTCPATDSRTEDSAALTAQVISHGSAGSTAQCTTDYRAAIYGIGAASR